jgi:hypothetical protein
MAPISRTSQLSPPYAGVNFAFHFRAGRICLLTRVQLVSLRVNRDCLASPAIGQLRYRLLVSLRCYILAPDCFARNRNSLTELATSASGPLH